MKNSLVAQLAEINKKSDLIIKAALFRTGGNIVFENEETDIDILNDKLPTLNEYIESYEGDSDILPLSISGSEYEMILRFIDPENGEVEEIEMCEISAMGHAQLADLIIQMN